MARGSRDVRVRSLRPEDHGAFVRLLRDTGMRPHTRGREAEAKFLRQLRSRQTAYLGAFAGDRLVGAVLGTHDTRKGWINRLVVREEYRRQGVASRLVRECERRLRAKGVEMFAALIEPGNRGSETLFRRLGYDLWRLTYARRKLRKGV